MQTKINHPAFRLGIDIGGTFTDFVIFEPASGKISTFKLPSTPHDPSEAVLLGINKLVQEIIGNSSSPRSSSKYINTHSSIQLVPQLSIVHGSTVATNALLERKGAPTALVTTQGFKDVIQIGRQNRPDLYDFSSLPPDPLVPPELRFEVDARVNKNGVIITPVQDIAVDLLIKDLQSASCEPESIAVVFLFSFTNPKHEQIIADKLRASGYFVSASHEILPEYREYERTSTTVVNAYVSPVLDSYLVEIESNLFPQTAKSKSSPINQHQPNIINLQIMQSNGGSISVSEARKSGVRCILSGPAGGVVGCQYIGNLVIDSTKQTDLRLLTFDMGGTSTDVSLIDGRPQITSEAEVGGLPIRIPVLDIHTIGAGGGSIASIDAGGTLRVGPESAGADPGPACYGRSAGKPSSELNATVTDANLLLGRILADRFLGGEMPLHKELAEAAISPIAAALGLSTIEIALGIIEIANAHMERALRVISVERGHDPRQFTLLSFGGAGSLHASDLARRLGIPRLLVPPYAATLSAFGMLTADVVKDYTQTVMLSGDIPIELLNAKLANLQERARLEIKAEGFIDKNIHLEPSLDMRYRGQSYELSVPYSGHFVEDFHQIHHQTYGYHRREANLEIVNLRVRSTGLVETPEIASLPIQSDDPSTALIEQRSVVLAKDSKEMIPFYRGEALKPGNIIPGPAIVLRDDTTILISESDKSYVDPYLNLIIDIGT